MKITFSKALLALFALAIFSALVFLFAGVPPRAPSIVWGVNFSKEHASRLGLNWAEVYLALLDDLGAKRIKLLTRWETLEPQEYRYQWEDLDWQIEQAEKRDAKIILVIGMKTGRWPECHIPQWARGLPKEKQQEKVLLLLEQIVVRYRDSPAIQYWQVENEHFFPFGDCPWRDKKFVQREVELVKLVDTKERPIIISDSGEWSLWWTAARLGDIVGTTMYKKVWSPQLSRHISLPFNPTFYWRKARLVKLLFGKDVIVTELQAEPWGRALLYDSPLEEQEKSMNLERFRSMVSFARRTGFQEFYLWGGEWWYWMKTRQGKPEIWNEAKTVFGETRL